MSTKPPKRKLSKAARRLINKRAYEAEMKEIELLRKRTVAEMPPSGYNPLVWEEPDSVLEPERVIIDPKDPNYAQQQAKLAKQKKDQEKQQQRGGSAETKEAPIGQTNVGVTTSALVSSFRKFAELPISTRTLRGLTDANYSHLTKIQRGALPHALGGRDILGSARTGSGKTLAFLIPCLEKLFLLEWDPKKDGLGVIILSPTRELAIQIFDVLRIIGKHHNYSAGLVIGGKDVKTEMQLIGGMNILVATLGRLQQHMEQSYDLDTTNVRMLVLDEADRILEMGFADALDAILANLPPAPQRQTLLFSATQTKEVRALAKLSLHEPEYIAVHDMEPNATPRGLSQHYMVIDAGLKLDALYSFIRTHLRSKTIVFATACKQVRFLFEMFRRTRPGVPLMHIHGKMSQTRRMEIYYDYCNRNEAVLFATDVAARGLDFPNVDWVVQLDCPDSPETYIHRVGRTARYRASGHALMMLLPSEIAMIEKLKAKRVELGKVKPDVQKMQTVKAMFAGYIAEDPDLKYLGQKAFISYVRSVHLQSDKEVFDVKAIDTAALAESFGLPGLPQIKKLKGSRHDIKNLPYAVRALMEQDEAKKRRKEKLAKGEALSSDDEYELTPSGMTKKHHRTEVERLLTRKNTGVLDKSRLKLREKDDIEQDDDADGFLKVKRTGAEFLQSKSIRGDGADEDSDFDEVTRWVREEGLVQDSSDSSDDEQSDDAPEDHKIGVKRSNRPVATEEMDEKAAKKAAKKAARKKELEERLRKAMLSNNVQIQSVDEAIRAGLDGSFVDELKAMVKAADPISKQREHERVHAKHVKRRLAERGPRKQPSAKLAGADEAYEEEEYDDDGYIEEKSDSDREYSWTYYGSDTDLNSSDEDDGDEDDKGTKRVRVDINLSETSDEDE